MSNPDLVEQGISVKCTVYKATRGTKESTIRMSLRVRNAIKNAHGLDVTPGYAVNVQGAQLNSPRNLIVITMARDDPLLRKNGVVRIGLKARKRLGIEPGDQVDVVPLKWEKYYHGTRTTDPLVICRDGWIVGGGNAFGSGVYLTTNLTTARAFGSTGIVTAEVAWGKKLDWPLSHGELRKDFVRWCLEHRRDPDTLLALPSLRNESDARVIHVTRWARLHGHYYDGGTGVRVFPGPIQSGYKPNRLRVVSVAKPDGTVLWKRSGD